MNERTGRNSDLRHQQRKRTTEISSSSGKIMPQSIELEMAVLGAILLEERAIDLVVDILQAESFYLEKHKTVYTAILDIFGKNPPEPIDLITVSEQLKVNGQLEPIGGIDYLVELTRHIKSAANLEVYARKLTEYAIKREMISISYGVQREGYEDSTDAFELLDHVQQDLFEVAEKSVRKSYASVKDVIRKALKDLENKRDQGEGLTGIPSGFTDLDRLTSGWQRSDLIILAARPGVGKTAFVLNAIRNAALDFSHPVAFFSLEMSSTQLVNRMISMETKITSDKIRTGNLKSEEWKTIYSKLDVLNNSPIYIDDTPALSITELRAKCRRLKSQYNISMIVVDYLQLMNANMGKGNNSNREQEISSISRNLKTIAKELEVPVIALSQLSRQVEQRQSKRPQLSDLRESGAIEQDADMVIFLYRPEYYGLSETPDGQPSDGLTELIVAKYRNGSPGTVNLKFLKEYTRFMDWEDHGLPGNFISLGASESNSFGAHGESTITIESKINSDISDDDSFFPYGNGEDEEAPF